MLISRSVKQIGEKYFENAASLDKRDRELRYYDCEYLNVSAAGKDVRLFRQERLINKSVQELMSATHTLSKNMSRIQGGNSGWNRGLTLAVSALFTGYVMLKVQTGAVPVGMIITYIGAISNVCSSVSHITVSIVDLQKILPYFDLWHTIPPCSEEFGFLDHTKKTADPIAAAPLRAAPTIKFDHVSYRYPNTERDALHDACFTLEAGQCAAVVGRNGSGKSTMIALLCRLLTPTSGKILISGRDIEEFSPEEHRSIYFSPAVLLQKL